MNLAISLEAQERELIQACMREERWAQRHLYEQFYGKMMSVSMRYAQGPDDAADILNEGFIKVFKYLHRYVPGTSLEAWIRRIVVNTAIDFYRRAARNRHDDIDTAYHLSSEQEDAISKCSADDIMRAVQSLPPSYRTVFNLYAIEGYSHKEIGELLGINESTSRSNLVKARLRLQEALSHFR